MVKPDQKLAKRSKYPGRAIIPFFISLLIILCASRAFAAEPVTIPAKNAGRYVGRTVKVRGKVVDVARSKNAIFINFGKDWRRDFTAVIFKGNFKDFEAAGVDPMKYKGRTIVISGVIQNYKGRPEIIVMTPGQIKAD